MVVVSHFRHNTVTNFYFLSSSLVRQLHRIRHRVLVKEGVNVVDASQYPILFTHSNASLLRSSSATHPGCQRYKGRRQTHTDRKQLTISNRTRKIDTKIQSSLQLNIETKLNENRRSHPGLVADR